jgi:D-alanyl-D-alanine carboxypeptidase
LRIRRLLLAIVASLCMLVATTAPGGAQEASTTTAPPPPPKAAILVDADTGAVLYAANEREARPVASLSKIITALAVTHALQAGTDIPVSLKAEGMPARKINMKAGQVWTLEDSLASMMLSSANDAAVALAERVSGNLEEFEQELGRTARRLGLEDDPVLRDPAGLDDEFSVGGGNLISARDLAIAARALLGEKRLAGLVALPEIRFVGGDGIQHHLTNHNRLLRTYPGAIGVKTGYTKRSGRCLVAAAQRDGRTMIAVVVDTYDMYGAAAALLDKGFATPVGAEPADHLPEVRPTGPVVSVQPALRPVADPELAAGLRRHQDELAVGALVLALGFVLVRRQRRKVWRRRQEVLARRAAYAAAVRDPAPDPSSRAVQTSRSPVRSHSPTL